MVLPDVKRLANKTEAYVSFHPFQGRPLFGLIGLNPEKGPINQMFPSLSGKTSIRTFLRWIWKGIKVLGRFPSLSGKTSIRTLSTVFHLQPKDRKVSIPFREDLYSDTRYQK